MAIPSSSMERTARSVVNQQAILAVDKEIKTIDALVEKGEKSPDDAVKEKELLEKKRPKEKKWVVNLSQILWVLLVITLAVAIVRALPEDGGMLWLFTIPTLPKVVGDLTIVLGPLLAVSVAIERLLETAFDIFEQSSRAVADVLAAPKEALDWIGREYQEAYAAAQKAADNTGVDVVPDNLKKLEAAELRLSQAESRLRGWTDSYEYKAWKRALSVWVGLLAGLMVAVLADIGMLHTIGVPAPRLLDMLLTGLVIGAGPGPMHSIIGVLQAGTDAVNNLAELAKGKALKEAREALESSTKK